MEAKLKIITKQYDEMGIIDTIEVGTIGKIFEKNKSARKQQAMKKAETISVRNENFLVTTFNIVSPTHFYFCFSI